MQTKSATLNVLLVEDNALDARLLYEYLEDVEEDIRLEHISGLKTALEILKTQTFAAILLDLSLPDAHGLSALEVLANVRPHPPIIVLTGLADNDTALQSLRAGAYDYLIKGQIDGPYLVRAIRYAVERAQADAALHQSEANKRALIQAIPDIILQYSPDGIHLDYQARNLEDLPLPPEAFLGRAIRDVFPEKMAERVHAHLELALSEGQSQFEQHLLNHNEARDYDVRMVKTDLGNVMALVRDITERKEAEDALRESEGKQRALLEAIPDLLLQYAPDGTYLSYHANTWDDLYVEPDAFIGKRIHDVLPPKVADLTEQNLHSCLKEGKAKFEYDLRVPNGLNTYEAHMVRTDEGTVLSLIRDITEHKQAEETLRRQNAYLGALHQTALGLMNRLELSELLDSLVKQITSLTGAPHGFVYLVNSAGTKLDLASGVGLHAKHSTLTLGRSEGVAGVVWDSGKPLLVDNYQVWERSAGDERFGSINTVMATPLKSNENVTGVIGIADSSRTESFSENNQELLANFAKLASIAFDNARLYEQTKLDLQRATALHEISQAITTSESLSELLHTISRNILAAVNAQWVVTYTLDVPRRMVTDSASVSIFETPLEPLSFEDLWESLSGWVLRERKSTLSPKKLKEARENTVVTQQRREQQVGSVIVTPLLYNQKQLGTISVLKHLDEPDFTQEDVILIESIANQVVIALEQRQLLDQIEHQAYHDALTGLPNRLLFEDRLEQSIARAKRSGFPFALLFIDLDGFKNVNDTLGHQIGDELLKNVTARLSNRMRESDTLARMGGDEFAFILNDLRSPADAVRVAERYLALFQTPFVIEGHELFITASIGVCLYPNDGKDAETLLRHSDSAMYRAKHLGKNDVQTFTPDLAEQAHKRLTLENQLRRALEKGELELHYQPQVNLQTGERVGVEALLRWRHTERGLVSPGDFIPIAEETNLILPMGEWVLHEACRQNAQWQREGHPPVRVAVNISPRQFSRPEFIGTVESALATSGLKPKYLELEVAESVVMHDISVVAERLQQLRDLGVRVAIDDFGTGYSSLTFLQRLPIDSLKIDRSFVNAIRFEGGEETSALVQIIMTMAQTFGLNVIAEGIETETQLEYLRSLDCQEAQGFYFAKPLPASEVWQGNNVEQAKA